MVSLRVSLHESQRTLYIGKQRIVNKKVAVQAIPLCY